MLGSAKKTLGIVMLASVLAMMMLAGCSQPEKSENAANRQNENSQPTQANTNANSTGADVVLSNVNSTNVNFATEPLKTDENTGRTSMPEAYTPGSVEDNTYTNKVAGISYAVPEGFSIMPLDKANQELNVATADRTQKVVIAYSTDGVLEDFITATYAHLKSQESPSYDYQADLKKVSIAGAERYLITTQMNYNDERSATAMLFFEGDGHIVCVSATAPDVDTATNLVALTKPL